MSIVNFLYNPDRKSKQQLISEFVVRENVLENIMEDLETSAMKTPEQHYLLVGQRGTGKTTLLNRIKYAVEDSDKLKKWLIPVIFREEQYNVSELANLWENIGQILEDYYGLDGLYTEMEKYAGKKNFEELCWDILERRLDKEGKKLVLLIDNLGDLFKKMKELEIRRLRELLQTRPQLRVIAGSSFYLESLLDYKQPLYEFFKVIRLEELDGEDTRKLLLKLGDIHKEREKIERIIKETPGRIETLRTLAGGVPRTIALIFNIFIENEQENSLNDLEKILDNVTPLYKHRMDDLPAQQQKIVDAVAKKWDPISVKELKEKVRLEGKTISAQLRQLEKNQVIQKMETDTKNHEYILKERFFNIWYLMRYGRKDDKQRVIWLVRFLESWCTDEEIEKRIVDFVGRMKDQKMDDHKIDFFGEVYSSINKLTLQSKFLLRESAPPKYGKLVYFTQEEIDKAISESFSSGDFKKSLKCISMLDRLTEKHKMLAWEIIEKFSDSNQDIWAYAKDMMEKVKEELNDFVSPSAGAFQLFMIFMIVKSGRQILYELVNDQFENALSTIKFQLIGLAQFVLYFENENYYWNRKLEIGMLLVGISELYSRGQFYSIKKIFDDGYIKRENKLIPFSEIFNPIYLALKSLDPEAKKVNLAPEKEEIVRQIRDFITAK